MKSATSTAVGLTAIASLGAVSPTPLFRWGLDAREYLLALQVRDCVWLASKLHVQSPLAPTS